MDALALIVSILGVAFGILYFTFLWDKKEHVVLRFIGTFVFITLLFLVPKVAFDNRYECEFVRVNETVSGNITTYGHDYVCDDKESQTVNTFYLAYSWFTRIFMGYVFIYLIYTLFMKEDGFVQRLRKGKGKNGKT